MRAVGTVDVRSSLPRGARRLPEDDVAPTRLREHELRSVLPRPIEHQVDGARRGGGTRARHPLDDLGIDGPLDGTVAVDLRRARPHVAHLQHDRHLPQRQPHQVRQRGPVLRVPGHHELAHDLTIRDRPPPAAATRCPRSVEALDVREQLGDELVDTSVDLVADRSHARRRLGRPGRRAPSRGSACPGRRGTRRRSPW